MKSIPTFPVSAESTPIYRSMMTAQSLKKRRAVIIADLMCKAEVEDWHGVQDCGSDLREIDVILKMLADVNP